MASKVTLPSVGITSPAFRYRPAAATDIRKTFARVKRAMLAEAREATPALHDVAPTVVPLPVKTHLAGSQQ